MKEYQLTIRQRVDNPRCRIGRRSIYSLLRGQNLRAHGGSGLAYYVALVCFAEIKSKRKRVGDMFYSISPGEWIGHIDDLVIMLGVHNRIQIKFILADLQKRHFISYNILANGNCVKYRIEDWQRYNRIVEENTPCDEETGFLFISKEVANEMIGTRRPSEMDALIDLILNTVYGDEYVPKSIVAPVVFMRTSYGRVHTYEDFAKRWHMPKDTAFKYLNKMRELNYIDIEYEANDHVINVFLKNNLSSMHKVCDVLLDKDSSEMLLDIKFELDDSIQYGDFSVSTEATEFVVKKVETILGAQGTPCIECRKFRYELLRLSDFEEKMIIPSDAPPQQMPKYRLDFYCGGDTKIATFEMLIKPVVFVKGDGWYEKREEQRRFRESVISRHVDASP